MLGFQRHVVNTVLGRLAVFRGIYTEDRKVAGMAWPLPVISVATKLTNRLGRGAYHAHIAIALVYKGEELVALEKRADPGFHTIGRIAHAAIDIREDLCLASCSFSTYQVL